MKKWRRELTKGLTWRNEVLLEKLIVSYLLKNVSPSTEATVSLPFLQGRSTGVYAEPDESIPQPPTQLHFLNNTRWFKYDRDYLCVNKSQFVPVIFEPPCISVLQSRITMFYCFWKCYMFRPLLWVIIRQKNTYAKHWYVCKWIFLVSRLLHSCSQFVAFRYLIIWQFVNYLR